MCDPILVTPLKMRPHYSQSSPENATLSSSTSPFASYKEVPPGGEEYTTGDDHLQQSNHRSSLLKIGQDTYIYFMEEPEDSTISELQYV